MPKNTDRIHFFDENKSVSLSPEQVVPDRVLVGRKEELRLCRAAFAMDETNHFSKDMKSLHFRLEGPPGVGKNEIVYQLARDLAKSETMPFYSIQGHEEMTPEDLSILVVPDTEQKGDMPLRLQSSPLATALIEGGLFFFDEINRVPDRALSPLASVLDDRRSLYSAMTGITIVPKDERARSRFRFCCALNPGLGQAGRGSLPDYISERTLPALEIDYLELEDLKKVIEANITTDQKMLDGFDEWYGKNVKRAISVRQAMSIITWATNIMAANQTPYEAILQADLNFRSSEDKAKPSKKNESD